MQDNAYRQDLVSVHREGCELLSIITMRRFPGYFRQIMRPIVYALQNFDRNFPNLVAPSTDGSAKCLMPCKSISGPLTNTEKSFQIDAWRRYPSSHSYEIDQKRGSKFGALLWRHLTP